MRPRTCRTAGRRCGCSGINAIGRVGNGCVGDGRSPRPACRSGPVNASRAGCGSSSTGPRRDPAAASRAVGPGLRPYEVRDRLHRFYALAAEADVPELTRLAGTVETWWPAVEAYLSLRGTNARTAGYHRKIK